MRRPLIVAAAALAAGALVLSGCTGQDGRAAAAPHSARADTSPLTARTCRQVACEGTIGGARYRVVLPATWNGTLLLYSHGYRFAKPVPPDFAAPDTSAVPAPGQDVADRLLAQGYALAGSSYSRNGWAVQEGVSADIALHDWFVKNVGTPRRTYLWGDSLGGLVTETLAEQGLPWVSGAAPLCGVLGGTNANLDLALDVAFAVKTLIRPQLRLTGYRSHEEAVKEFEATQRALVSTALSGLQGAAEVALVAALVDAPDQTARFDGSTPVSRISAAVEAALTGLGYGTYGRWEIEQRAGGNPSSNVGVDYATRVSPAERQLVDLAGGPGTTDALLARLAKAPRVTAAAAARTRADALGDPTGDLRVPTLTLHTTKDPLVLVQNESLFAGRVAKHDDQGSLLQLYVAPPPSYTAPAPYGAGHCNFTTQQRLAVVDLLDRWVRSGRKPDAGVQADALYDAKGVDQTYRPPGWPAST